MTAPVALRVSEAAPLLSSTASETAPSLLEPPKKKSKPWVLLCVLVFVLIAIVDIGEFLAEGPKTRVFEANLCERYYREQDPSKILPDGTVNEEYCKEDEIQQKLASIFGWQDLFDAIPGILLAVPFGTLADKYGRKWVLASSLLGLQLSSSWVLFICWFRSFSLQLTWVSSIFFLIGGGPMVATAIGLSMVSDICPPEKRTAIFVYLMASVLVAELMAPIIAARLMENGAWLPLLLALGIQQVGISIAIFFPETLHLRDLPEPEDDQSEPIREPINIRRPSHRQIRKLFGPKAQIHHFQDAFRFLRRDLQVTLAIFTFFASRIGRQVLSLLIRYASKRYHWKIAKANYLLSFRAATNLVALTVCVPVVNLILLRVVRLPAHLADIWLARGSALLSAFSFFLMAASADPALLIIGLLVYNLGTGYGAAMRSISIYVVGGQSSPDIGRLFAVIAIMENVGSMIAGPTLAAALQWGIDHGEPWIGMPFVFAMVVFALMSLVTFLISVKDKPAPSYDEVQSSELSSPMASPVLEQSLNFETMNRHTHDDQYSGRPA